MNPRYRETFHSHRVLFVLPVILGAVFALWTAAGSQKLYRSNASLWSGSASGTTAFGAQPPAVQDQMMLGQLLQTESFTRRVASRSPLQAYLASHPNSGSGPMALLKRSLKGTPSLDDRITAALSAKRVTTLAPGNNLLQISFEAPEPALARATLVTLLHEFGRERARLDKAELTTTKQQVVGATNALADAKRNLNLYVGTHPGSGTADPQLQSLRQAQTDAVSQLSAATQALNQATNDLLNSGGSGVSIETLDAPNLPVGATTGKKKVLESTVAGAFAGALLSVLLIVILTKTRLPETRVEPAAEPPSTNGHHPHDPDEERIVVEAPQEAPAAGETRRAPAARKRASAAKATTRRKPRTAAKPTREQQPDRAPDE
jgi:hypothetical protein